MSRLRLHDNILEQNVKDADIISLNAWIYLGEMQRYCIHAVGQRNAKLCLGIQGIPEFGLVKLVVGSAFDSSIRIVALYSALGNAAVILPLVAFVVRERWSSAVDQDWELLPQSGACKDGEASENEEEEVR